MALKDLICEEISCEHLVQDQWIDFRRSAYRFPDGRVFEPYYSYTRRDYVVIVASDEEGNYLCVRQFRQGIRTVTTEFPAGGIEQKDGDSCWPGSSGRRTAVRPPHSGWTTWNCWTCRSTPRRRLKK